jgi:hypothetical protein
MTIMNAIILHMKVLFIVNSLTEWKKITLMISFNKRIPLPIKSEYFVEVHAVLFLMKYSHSVFKLLKLLKTVYSKIH